MGQQMNTNVKMKFVINGELITLSYSLDEILTLGLSYERILQEAGAKPGSTITETLYYVGRKDDRGIEIYAGDILSNSFMDDYPGKRSLVVFENDAWRLKVGTVLRPIADNAGWSSMSSARYGKVEVIGNRIYDPELLEQ